MTAKAQGQRRKKEKSLGLRADLPTGRVLFRVDADVIQLAPKEAYLLAHVIRVGVEFARSLDEGFRDAVEKTADPDMVERVALDTFTELRRTVPAMVGARVYPVGYRPLCSEHVDIALIYEVRKSSAVVYPGDSLGVAHAIATAARRLEVIAQRAE